MKTGSRDTRCNKCRNEFFLDKFLEWPYFAVEQWMKCGVWKSEMELILSEYLISIRVVDYCSLGLLSENKIKRKRVPVGKHILISVRECKKSQLKR